MGEWLIICDIDEYFYMSDNMKLIDYFNSDIKSDQLWVPWRLFGSKYIDTPKSLVKSLLVRKEKQVVSSSHPYGYGKSIIRTNKLQHINVHSHEMNEGSILIDVNFNDSLRLNHYKLISESYYKYNKCVRQGGETKFGMGKTYTMEGFYGQNKAYLEIEDNVLAKKYN